MASTSACDNRKELKEIAIELREINRRLDRLCRAFIFSIDGTEIEVINKSEMQTSQDKQCL